MNTISNTSLKMDTNIYAMNQAKKLPEMTVGKLLESASAQQTQMAQQTAQSVAAATGLGNTLDVKA